MTDPSRLLQIAILGDLLSEIGSSDFSKFVVGALVAGSVYLLVMKVGDKLTSNFVRKDELKQELEAFKAELTEELVTAQDLQVFKLEGAAEMEKAMKETRHALRGEVQPIVLEMNALKLVLARIEEHFKEHPPK